MPACQVAPGGGGGLPVVSSHISEAGFSVVSELAVASRTSRGLSHLSKRRSARYEEGRQCGETHGAELQFRRSSEGQAGETVPLTCRCRDADPPPHLHNCD